MKMVDVIQQSKRMISNFILIFQQPRIRYKDLELEKMNDKMAENFKRMKSQTIDEYKKLMHELNIQGLECDEIEPSDDLIFVKYRTVRDRVRPQVLIEFDFNKLR